MLKFIGLFLEVQQDVIQNIYIVDEPDETWDDRELYNLFRELKGMLEIDARYRALEHKLRIITDTIDIIVDLAKTRKGVLLEMVIIILIAFEIVMSLYDRFFKTLAG